MSRLIHQQLLSSLSLKTACHPWFLAAGILNLLPLHLHSEPVPDDALPDLAVKRFVSFPFERFCPEPYPEWDNDYDMRWTNDCPGARALQLVFDTQTRVDYGLFRIMDGTGTHVPGSPFFYGWYGAPSQFVPGDRAILEIASVVYLARGRIKVVEIAALGLETTNTVAEPHQAIELSWTVENEGAATAQPSWHDELWLSLDPVWDISDVRLGAFRHDSSLPPGTNYVGQGTVRIPGVPAGSYWLLLEAASDSPDSEATRTNNTLAIPLEVRPPADLVPRVNIPPLITTNRPNPWLELTWTVTNIGVSAARGEWYDTIYISTNAAFDEWARPVHSILRTEPLYVGTLYTETQSIMLPISASGQYYLFFWTDGEHNWVRTNRLYEIDESNNVVVVPFEFELKAPDLVATVAVPEIVTPSGTGARVQFGWTIANQGVGPANPPWPNTSLAFPGGKIFTEYSNVRIDPQERTAGYSFFELPNATNGAYQLVFRVDNPFICNCVFESNDGNNEARVPFRVVSAPPGLVAAGSEFALPIRLRSSANLTSLEFNIRLPSGGVSHLAIQPPSYPVQHASITQTASNTYAVRLAAYSGLSFRATPDVVRLFFQTAPDQPSAFVPILFEDIIAKDSAGQPVEGAAIDSVRMVVIGREPLLEIHALPGGQHTLTVYAWPQRTVSMETSSTLANWSPLLDFIPTTLSRGFGPFPNGDHSLFYRARW